MTVFIDGDGCNAHTRMLAERLSNRNVHVVLVANTLIPHKEHTSMQICPATADATDNYIIAHAKYGDLVITRDLLLAKALLTKEYNADAICDIEGSVAHNSKDMAHSGIYVISDFGERYTHDIIDARIQRSEYAKQYRSTEFLLPCMDSRHAKNRVGQGTRHKKKGTLKIKNAMIQSQGY